MKLYTILAFAMIATLLFAMPMALAEETDDSVSDTDSVIAPAPEDTEDVTSTEVDEETVAELNDDLDESVTPVRMGWENVKLWFTFNNEKKAMQEFKIARLRLVQARIAARNNDTEAMQNALEAHNRILERIQARIDAIDGASDEKGAKAAADKLIGLERAIEVHEARISKLNAILASENLSEQQRAVIEARLAKAENNTAHLKEVQAAKEEKIKTRLRAVSNMTEEEIDSLIEELEDAKNLSELRKLIAEKKIEHKKLIAEKLKERIEEMKERLKEGLKNESEDESEDELESKNETESESETELENETESENNSS